MLTLPGLGVLVNQLVYQPVNFPLVGNFRSINPGDKIAVTGLVQSSSKISPG